MRLPPREWPGSIIAEENLFTETAEARTRGRTLLKPVGARTDGQNLIAAAVLGRALLFLVVIFGSVLTLPQSLLVSTNTNTIRKFSLTGGQATINFFGPPGLAGDVGLALDRFNNVYVANIFGNAIRKFSPRGR